MIRTFNPSPPTVGLELEWQLVDASTLDLRDGIVPLAELLPPFASLTTLEQVLPPLTSRTTLEDNRWIKPEMLQTAVETVTPPGPSTTALRGDLHAVVHRLAEAAARCGIALVGAGMHAFSERLVPVTPLPRYLALERSAGYLAHTQVVYSLQTHVGMPSAEVAIRVMQDLRGFLPILLALSASSPFAHGHETPFASYRHRTLASTRSSGMPPSFEDWPNFIRFLDTVERANVFGSFRDMHWDVRLRPDFGTIEVRIMDAQPTLDQSLALAALVHSLLVRLASAPPRDAPFIPPLAPWIEKENAYRASHDGVDALLICSADGTVGPLSRLAEDLFELLTPTARELGEEEDLARARRILSEGPSYRRQLEVFHRTGSTREVVRALADELLADLG